MAVINPLTARDALYSEPFPSYNDFDNFVKDLKVVRRSVVV